MRRNVDLTYIVMDNQIYGLTTGQCSPTERQGNENQEHAAREALRTRSIRSRWQSLAVPPTSARAFSGKQKHMVEMLKGAIQHKGFALVDVFSPCVTYNKDNTYQWFNPRVKILEEQGHDPTDLHQAIERGFQWGDEIPIGLFWRRTDLQSLEDLEPVLHTGEGPLAFRKLGVSPEQAKRLIQELL
jgi:2-oxoglutarate ferredoxin oxidoreductase subunit beta